MDLVAQHSRALEPAQQDTLWVRGLVRGTMDLVARHSCPLEPAHAGKSCIAALVLVQPCLLAQRKCALELAQAALVSRGVPGAIRVAGDRCEDMRS